MKYLLLIPLLWLSNPGVAQSVKDTSQRAVKAGYGEAVEQTPPDFPGGRDSLSIFLKRNLHYPKQALLDGVRGKVWMSFMVSREGKIKDETVVKSVSAEIDQEALRLLKLMPDWTPATTGGKPVDSSYILQVEFIPPGQRP